MWRKLGKVPSKDIDKSIRSNRSKSEDPFQAYHSVKQRHSASLQQKKPQQHLCPKFINKKRTDQTKNFSSDEDNEEVDRKGQDMFTQMRNTLKHKGQSDSNLEEHKKRQSSNDPNSNANETNKTKTHEKTSHLTRKTVLKVNNLKKDHQKLKKYLQLETASFKDYFSQFQKYIKQSQQLTEKNNEQKNIKFKIEKKSQKEREFFSNIAQEGQKLKYFFIEADERKQEIVNKYNQIILK